MSEIYKTKQGDTWDLIAYKFYKNIGGEYNLINLIDENSIYKDFIIFPAGINLTIPDLDIPLTGGLPPWEK